MLTKLFNRLFNKRSLGESILYAFVFLFFGIIAISYIYIYIWVFFAALKTHTEVNLRPFAFPTKWIFKNFFEVLTTFEVAKNNFFQMTFNSIWFAAFGPFITLFFTSLLAYVTTKFRFFGSRVFFYIVIIVVTLPVYGNTGAMYKLLYKLNLRNSYMQLILAFGGVNVYFLYFSASFKSVSWTYAEAAYIDGANDFHIYFKIMFPMIKPLFIALFIMYWQTSWNSYDTALIYLDKLPVLASGIYSFELDMIYNVRMDLLYAAYFISAIPALLVFAFCNKLLTTNISLGGIKE